jgi:hypothetical protein
MARARTYPDLRQSRKQPRELRLRVVSRTSVVQRAFDQVPSSASFVEATIRFQRFISRASLEADSRLTVLPFRSRDKVDPADDSSLTPEPRETTVFQRRPRTGITPGP